jgi:catechol 2,3-dioxygenase
MTHEPCFDVAHLGHLELLTDKPEASLDFFVNVYGLTESGREGDSVYLRAWDDYEFHTLKLTASDTTGMAHVGYRTSSQAALERRVEVIEKMGCGIGWTDGDLGHGAAYRFSSPDGHVFELYYDTRNTSPQRSSGRRSRTWHSAIMAGARRCAGSTTSTCSRPTSRPCATS